MKKHLLAFAMVLASLFVHAQCTTNNATGCQCKDPLQTDCDLLPDIQIGHPPFYQYDIDFGVKEFSQSGNVNAADNGKLYVTVSTPNTGHGPLEIYTTDTFICQLDTFFGTAPAICPDGITYPKILVNQRIYHKTGNTMTTWVRPAGTMTYHPLHNHMHVDNWGNYTIRTRDTLDPDPLHWPILGDGTKLAFCVEDYGTCPNYPGHCLDSAGNSLNNSSDFPNYGLGGGNYNCSPVTQGISSGYVDIYWTTLAGMYIELPPNLCNGDYYIVCEVDPNHNFLEEDENNNSYAAPITLKKQMLNPSMQAANVSIAGSRVNLCAGESVTLSAQLNTPNVTYHWSTGDTTQFTTVNSTGTYTVDITNQCGTGTSLPVNITVLNPPAAPAGVNDTIPVPGTATLAATASGAITWYDQPVGGSAVGTGNSFITPFLNTSTTYYAQTEETHPGAVFATGLADSAVAGQGSYSSTNQSLIFDCYNPFILHTVKVYSQNNNSNLSIELYDSLSTLLQYRTVSVSAGMNVVVLDFTITPGTGYRITRSGGNLFRNNPGSNVGYPFVIPNFCSITGTTAGSGYYYFFYDWDIRLPDNSCTSARTPVEAYILQPNALADVSVLHSLKVFPNPAKDRVRVSFETTDAKAVVELLDALGKMVTRKEILAANESTAADFEVRDLNRGIYFIHILSSGKNYYHKLILD
jgi:hypothetical protein